MTEERIRYPITITQSRYGGTYEDAPWVAFNLRPEDIPADAFGSDVTCVDWWFENGEGVGKGDTPDEAWESLLAIEEPLRLVRSAMTSRPASHERPGPEGPPQRHTSG